MEPHVESHAITTTIHHVFFWDSGNKDALASHINEQEIEDFRIVAVTPTEKGLMFVMRRPPPDAERSGVVW